MLRGLAFGEHLTENLPFFLKPGCDAPGACLRRTPHRKLALFLNQGVTLRGAAFGEHLIQNGPFFLKPGSDAPGAAFGEHLTEN